MAGEGFAPVRRFALEGVGAGVRLPALFHSVSSHDTRIAPAAAVKLLSLFGRSQMLVSAFDVHGPLGQKIVDDIASYRAAGGVVILDCGNYEADRKRSRRWTVERFHEVLGDVPCDLAFAFDDLFPPADVDKATTQLLCGLERDVGKTTAPVIPIVHAPRRNDGSRVAGLLPRMVCAVARAASPVMVAVAERELGDGIVARARAVRAIRQSLEGSGTYVPLHVLGTGDPLSIAVLVAAGADSFDGLEWCRGSVDRQTGRVHHFHHQDLFAYQSDVASSPMARAAARDPHVTFPAKVALHNLDFFDEWMAELRAAVQEASLVRFLKRWLPMGGGAQVSQALGDGS